MGNIHVVYSGRGYHIRVLDEDVMGVDSDVVAQIVKYLVGADVPENEYSLDYEKVSYEHFVIPFGYPNVSLRGLNIPFFISMKKQSLMKSTRNS